MAFRAALLPGKHIDGERRPDMPSWNIHIAQAERLLAREGAVARTVRDRNAFLFGNLVPDIYVGYMVPGITQPIPYRLTHLAKPEPIPKPREREFWETYVAPLLEHAESGSPVPLFSIADERERLNRVHYPQRYEGAPPPPAAPDFAAVPTATDLARSVLDMALGTWAHLLADNLWNNRVNEYLDAHGGKPSEQFRIKKQADFDDFGKTLDIAAIPCATERLLVAAAAFPQYAIERPHAMAAVGVAHEIVRANAERRDVPRYRLLTGAFFERTFEEVLAATERELEERQAEAE